MPGPQSTPLLSLCLATFNRARYLDRYLTHHLGALDDGQPRGAGHERDLRAAAGGGELDAGFGRGEVDHRAAGADLVLELRGLRASDAGEQVKARVHGGQRGDARTGPSSGAANRDLQRGGHLLGIIG